MSAALFRDAATPKCIATYWFITVTKLWLLTILAIGPALTTFFKLKDPFVHLFPSSQIPCGQSRRQSIIIPNQVRPRLDHRVPEMKHQIIRAIG